MEDRAKSLADLLLGIPVKEREWLVETNAHKSWFPQTIPFLASGVSEGIISKSFAKRCLALYINQLQAMSKHGKIEGDSTKS